MRAYLGLTMRAGGLNPKDAVLDLQHDLRALGYLRNGLDGAFGAGTRRALIALTDDLCANPATPLVAAHNHGRVPHPIDELTPALGDCIAELMDDAAFPKTPSSADPRTDNATAIAALRAAPSDRAPTPFLLAMVRQESDSQHYRVPTPKDADHFVVVGLDRGDKAYPDRITSRGYGLGQYTIFHHPPKPSDVTDFIVDIQGNVSKAYTHLREKMDRFVTGPTDTADDHAAEHPLRPLILCRYKTSDARYMRDCAACARAAPKLNIVCDPVNGTPLHPNAKPGQVYRPTAYYANTEYRDVPDRAALGCDWPYAARRYNGSGVDSFHYQARILLNLAALP